MSQMVGYVPTTLSDEDDDVTLMSAKLATTFFIDSFIHAKEKLNIVQWIESLTKQVRQITLIFLCTFDNLTKLLV